MSTAFTGHGTVLGLGRESTWDTAVSRSVWMGTTQMGIARVQSRIPRNLLGESTGSRNRRKLTLASDYVQGPIGLELTYAGFGLVLEAWLGQVSTTGSGPYVHSFRLARALPVGLTLEAIIGDSGVSELFSGCKLSRGSLVIEAGKIATWSGEVMGGTAAARGAAGSPSFTTSRDMVVAFHEAGNVTWNGDTLACTKMEISNDNRLTNRQHIGSAKTKEPTPAGAQDVLVKLEVEYENDDLYNAYLAGTESDLTVTFTSVDGETIAVTANAAIIESCSMPISSQGVLMQSLTLRCQVDAGSEGLVVAVTNDQSSAIAA